jgi:hypothetical protein
VAILVRLLLAGKISLDDVAAALRPGDLRKRSNVRLRDDPATRQPDWPLGTKAPRMAGLFIY